MRDWLDRRPTVLPLLALGAVLIALAAGPSPAEGSWTRLPDASLFRWVFTALVLTLAAIGLAILLATRTVVTPGETRRRRWFATLVALFLIGLFSLIDFEAELPPPEEPEEQVVATAPPQPEVEPGPPVEGQAQTLSRPPSWHGRRIRPRRHAATT